MALLSDNERYMNIIYRLLHYLPEEPKQVIEQILSNSHAAGIESTTTLITDVLEAHQAVLLTPTAAPKRSAEDVPDNSRKSIKMQETADTPPAFEITIRASLLSRLFQQPRTVNPRGIESRSGKQQSRLPFVNAPQKTFYVQSNTRAHSSGSGRTFVKDAAKVPGLLPGCWAYLVSLPQTQKRCQWFLWELFTVLGVAGDLPIPSAANGYPRDQMDAIWAKIGCLAPFWMSDSAVIGTAKPEYMRAEGLSFDNSGLVPTLPGVVPFVECQCGGIHMVTLKIIDILMIGSGYLNSRTIEWLSEQITGKQQPQRSHLCHVAWCHSALHRFVETNTYNTGRRPCLTKHQQCVHTPPCAVELYAENNNIDALVSQTIELRKLYETLDEDQEGEPRVCCSLEFTTLNQYIDHIVVTHRSADAEILAENALYCRCEGKNLSASMHQKPVDAIEKHATNDCTAMHPNYPKPYSVEGEDRIYRSKTLLRFFRGNEESTDPTTIRANMLKRPMRREGGKLVEVVDAD